MQFNAFRLQNYKSFKDSGWIEFGPGFNVIVGQNNSGKSALLEAMRLGTQDDRPFHDPDRPANAPQPPHSIREARLLIQGLEVAYAIGRSNIALHFPVPDQAMTAESVREMLLDSGKTLVVHVRFTSNGGWQATRYPSHNLFDHDPPNKFAAYFPPQLGGTELLVAPDLQQNDQDSLMGVIPLIFAESFFHFRAERLAVGSFQAVEQSALQPNASNLASCLNALQRQPRVWREFNSHVRDIFPSVDEIVTPLVQSTIQIDLIAPTRPEQRQIAIPLSESGTGVGQVLAILYASMTQKNGCIVIDEPNTFLHPGAAKKLVNILKQYSQNQYIISTHSPDLIAVADPSSVILVSKEGAESKIHRVDRRELGEVKAVLSDLGVSLGDVFGCEQVVWVEGQTEAACFPMILKHFGIAMPLGLSFIPFAGATDFDGPRPRASKIMQVYRQLSGAHGLLPTAVAFSLDREERSPEKRAEIEKESNGSASFLPRRMFENYLIDEDAIAAVLADFGVQVQVADVRAWLETNWTNYPPHGDAAEWQLHNNAARLLADIFDELSGAKLEFRKTTHSPALTAWLLRNKPDSLSEVRDYLVHLIR